MKKYLMSSAQRRLYTIQKLSENSIAYNVPAIFKVSSELDSAKLLTAINTLIERHEILRTHFSMIDGGFAQIVNETADIEIEQYDLTHQTVDDVVETFIRPFDLLQAPLLRVGTAGSKEDSYLLLDLHHIITDGTSSGIFLQELIKAYNGETLQPIKLQYKDFSAWQRKQSMERAKEYWMNEFKNTITEISLPYDFVRPNEETYHGDIVSAHFDSSIYEAIQNICKENDVTEFMVVLSAFMSFIARYCKESDITIGTSVSGRTHIETEQMLGMFVNTIVLRANINKEENFISVLQTVKEKCINGFDNQDYPFDQLVQNLSLEKDNGRNPMFDIMFTYQNTQSADLKSEGLHLIPYEFKSTVAKFDLTFNMGCFEGEYDVIWEYRTDLFKKETMNRLINNFKWYCKNLFLEPAKKIKEIDYLMIEEMAKINQFNNRNIRPDNRNVVQLFEESAALNLNKTAITKGDTKLNYAQLKEASDLVASVLAGEGVVKGDFVAVKAEQSIETIIAMIGILKAGAAYVAVDPKNPKERTDYILEDSNCNVILVREYDSNILNKVKSLIINDIIKEPCKQHQPLAQSASSHLTIEADTLAYLMYTSGTTGKPKGTLIAHESIVRLVMDADFADFKDLRLLQSGSIAFDASTFEIWGTLLNGGTLLLPEEDTLTNPILFKEFLVRYKVNTMWLTSSLFNQMLSLNPTIFNTLRQLLIGGEKLSEPHVKRFFEHNNQTKLINGYGPTECTTFALTHTIKGAADMPIPIGKPINKTTAYIVKNDEICPVGIAGELYLGGAGLSKGYLNLGELTEEKFIDDPFYHSGKLYKTGDIVKWRDDGSIDYIGRNDEQIKLRGFRIELDEITEKLLSIEHIKEAVTLLREVDSKKYLCAYISESFGYTDVQIKEILSKVLPDYMIPSFIFKVDTIKTTVNGKIDKNALPLPKHKKKRSTKGESALTDNEKILLTVVKEVMLQDDITIEDDFFTIGGDSIQAISITSKLRNRGYELSVRKLMDNRILSKIAKELTGRKDIVEETSNQDEYFKMTPIIHKFFNEELEEPNHFNQSILLEGRADINVNAVKSALEKLVKHHDILRADFSSRPYVESEEKHKLNKCLVYYLSENEESDQNEIYKITHSIQKKINIKEGPLYLAAVIIGKRTSYLFMTLHHLIVDNVSWGILLEDFSTLYDGFVNKQAVVLPHKSTTFKTWSLALDEYAEKESLIKEQDHWKEIVDKVKESLIEKNSETNVNKMIFSQIKMPAKITGFLNNKLSYLQGITIRDFLLTAYARTAVKLTGNSTVSVNLEGHGREELFDNYKVDRTVGWFTTMYPMAFSNIGGELSNDLNNVANTIKNIPNNGIGYGLLAKNERVDLVDASVTFNYLGEISYLDQNASNFIPSELEAAADISNKNIFGSNLTLNIMKMNNDINISFGYNSGYYSGAWVYSLLYLYFEELQTFIDQIIECPEEFKIAKADAFVFNKPQLSEVSIDKTVRATGMQSYFLDNYMNSLVKFELELYGNNEQTIRDSLTKYMQSQTAFLTSVKKQEDGYYIYEHHYKDMINIPYLDAQNMTPEMLVQLKHSFYTSYETQEYSEDEYKLLHAGALLKHDKNKYTFLLIISHCVWDKTSEVIFKDNMQEIINNSKEVKLSDANRFRYQSNNIIMEDMSYIEDYLSRKADYLKLSKDIQPASVETTFIPFKTKTLDHIRMLPWDIINYITDRIIKANLNLEDKDLDFPAYMVQNDRRFLPDIQQQIGCFLDILPVVVSSSNNNFADNINHMQKMKEDHYINYSETLYNKMETLDLDLIYSINNQTIFELSHDDMDRIVTMARTQTSINGFEIVFNICSDGLFLLYAVSNKCEQNIAAKLLDECMEWENEFILKQETSKRVG